MPLSFDSVIEARDRIAGFVHRTPVLTSATFDRELGAQVFFKCENLQKVGAFKARGAVNALFSMSDAVAERGVVTHSSGNHGAALAYAAGIRRVPCTVVMPEDAPPTKIAAVREYCATVVLCKRTERQQICDSVREETGATYIPSYDYEPVIAGQGTAALELLEDFPDLDMIVTPIGGGGLLGGTALAASGLGNPAIVGAEPEAADDSFRSLTSGVRQPAVPSPATIADGLMMGIGELNFEILRTANAEIVTVSEAAILRAALDHLERMKLVVEPSGAAALAAIRARADDWKGRKIGAIISGGNTDFSWIPDARRS